MKAKFIVKWIAFLMVAVLATTAVMMLQPVADQPDDTFISQGLVAWYDGDDNQANGQNDLDADIWVNKVNPDEDWNIDLLVDDGDKFVENGFQITNDCQLFPQGVVDAINGTFTVEVDIADFVGTGTKYHTFLNCDNDNFSLFVRVDSGCLEFKYAGLTRETRPELPNGVELLKNSTVTVTYAPGDVLCIYVDGELLDSRLVDVAMGADNFFFGHYKETHTFTSVFKDIRIYDRALTAEEVAHNARVAQLPPVVEETEAPTEAETLPETIAETMAETMADTTAETVAETVAVIETDAETVVEDTQDNADTALAEGTQAPIDDTTQDETPEGCASVVGLSGVALASLLAVGALWVRKKKIDLIQIS